MTNTLFSKNRERSHFRVYLALIAMPEYFNDK